jgi:hypothetical protein
MRIFQLTNMGNDIAKEPSNDPSEKMKIIYFMRRHGGKATDEQLNMFVVQDKWILQKALRGLKDSHAVIEI